MRRNPYSSRWLAGCALWAGEFVVLASTGSLWLMTLMFLEAMLFSLAIALDWKRLGRWLLTTAAGSRLTMREVRFIGWFGVAVAGTGVVGLLADLLA